MRVFVIANQKGGVGKTTTTINLASALASKGKKVLTIDLDPQGNLSSGLGYDRQANIEKPSIYDVLVSNKNLSEVFVTTSNPNLFLVPANLSLAGAEIEMVNLLARESILKNAINKFQEKIDYVFIDCPPSLGLLTINALTAANFIIIPIQCEYFALEGLGQLLQTKELVSNVNPQLDIGGVILTMFDSRTKLSTQVASEVRNYFPEKLFKTAIPRNVRLSEAPSYGQDIFEYDSNSTGAKAYSDLAKEFLKRFN